MRRHGLLLEMGWITKVFLPGRYAILCSFSSLISILKDLVLLITVQTLQFSYFTVYCN